MRARGGGVRALRFVHAHAAAAEPTPALLRARARWPRSLGGVAFDTYIDWLLIAGAVSLLGCPAVCVPAGFTAAGLPVGVSLVGAPGQEAAVLEAAAAYEAAHAWAARVPRDPALL